MMKCIKRREERLNKERKKKKKSEGGNEGESVGGAAAMLCSPGVFFSLPLPPPPCLPHRGDLDLEECAPCSVSGENRGGERKELLTASPTSCCLQKSYGISSSFVFLDAC